MTRSFSAWSELRPKAAPLAPLWLVLFFGANAAACTAGCRRAPHRERLAGEALAFLLVMAAIEFTVCALADDLGASGRHPYVFQAMCDLVLIADASWLVECPTRRERHEEPDAAPA